MASSFMRFLDHTQQCTIGRRTLLDKWSGHCRDFWQHTTLTRDRHPCPSRIWTPNLSRQAPTDLCLTPCCHWDRHCTVILQYIAYIYIYTHTHIYIYMCVCVCVCVHMYVCIYRYRKRSFREFQICHYLMWIIWTATDNPLSHPVTPSCTRESPIAAKPTRCTTWNQILCWKVEVLCAIWMYANPVWHGFHGTKCLEIYIYIYTHRDLNTKTLTEHITCLFN